MSWTDVGLTILRVGALVGVITVVVLLLTYLERKALGRIQMRMGPMRTGFHGTLQPFADALKLLLKEDVVPSVKDKAVFWLAPLVVFVPALVLWITIPFTHDLVVRNLEFGIFYIIAVSVVSIVGIVMAGWGSNNKYALLGGARAAAQLISYELPIILVVVAVVMIAGTLNMREIVEGQGDFPYVYLQPLGFVVFLGAGLAELRRTPFDIPTAESEVMGGPFVEYSGIHWGMFFLAEYANTFAIGALATVLFLGGWSGPLLPGLLWFAIKTIAVIFVIFWLRATLPRFRIDQLMAFCWKFLIPISFLNIFLTGIYAFYEWPDWSMFTMSAVTLVGGGYMIWWHGRRRAAQRTETLRLRREKLVA
ncbi:MAG: NADH-quinone oxidoreductase subunit NuoH [Dehalococcoidia bacterium]